MGNGAFRDTPEQPQILTSQLAVGFLDASYFCCRVISPDGNIHIFGLVHGGSPILNDTHLDIHTGKWEFIFG